MNMKRIIVLLVVSMFAVGMAHAQLQVGPYFSIAAADDEYGYGGGIRGVQPLTENLLLDFRVSYLSYLHNDAVPVELGLLGTASTGSCQWYAGGGCGYYIYMLDSETLDDTAEPGFFVTGGASLTVTDGVRLFAEVKYTSASVHLESDRRALPGGGTSWTEADRGLDGIGGNIGILWEL
jgi:hypothetical protein